MPRSLSIDFLHRGTQGTIVFTRNELIALRSSIAAAAFNRFDGLLERGLIHCHQVTGFGETAALHVLGVFCKCGDALVLEPFVFVEEVPVGLDRKSTR